MITISNIFAIFQKELQTYFASPLAYIVAAVFWLITGAFFVFILSESIGSIAQQEQMGYPLPPIDLAYEFLRAFLDVLGSLVLFIMPILSMGLYAEERKRGTLELLATSPITNWSVAVGKLLAVITFFTFMLFPLLIYEAIAFSAANPPISLTIPLFGHLGLILLAASILSLGMFISSLTDSSIIAAILTFSLSIFLWIIDLTADKVGGFWGQVLGHLSLLDNYNNFTKGVFNLGSLVLFLSYIILGIFLTAQSIETLRFQRS